MFSHMLFTPFSQGQSARWGKKLKIMPYPRANNDNHMLCLSTPLPTSFTLIDVSEVKIIFWLKFSNQG